jgi:hypothetical protein
VLDRIRRHRPQIAPRIEATVHNHAQSVRVGGAERHLIAALLVRRHGQVHGHALHEPKRRIAIEVELAHERVHDLVLQHVLARDPRGGRRNHDAGAEVAEEQPLHVRRQEDICLARAPEDRDLDGLARLGHVPPRRRDDGRAKVLKLCGQRLGIFLILHIGQQAEVRRRPLAPARAAFAGTGRQVRAVSGEEQCREREHTESKHCGQCTRRRRDRNSRTPRSGRSQAAAGPAYLLVPPSGEPTWSLVCVCGVVRVVDPSVRFWLRGGSHDRSDRLHAVVVLPGCRTCSPARACGVAYRCPRTTYGWVSTGVQMAMARSHPAADLPGLRTCSPARACGVAYRWPRTAYSWVSKGLQVALDLPQVAADHPG